MGTCSISSAVAREPSFEEDEKVHHGPTPFSFVCWGRRFLSHRAGAAAYPGDSSAQRREHHRVVPAETIPVDFPCAAPESDEIYCRTSCLGSTALAFLVACYPALDMASSTLRSRTEAGGGVLPIDAVYEILIRLPAEELCRLRVVCQPWRSLLSDPKFIAAHADCQQLPLIIAEGHGKSYRGDCHILCRIMDLSGRNIKYIRWTSREDEQLRLICTQDNLACFAKGNSMCCQLLNLVTGERFALPEGLSQEHKARKLNFMNYRASVGLGQVASTGEFKLLRVIDNNTFSSRCEQLCEVFTLRGSSDKARWRGKKVAQGRVHMGPLSRVVINGVVYFLLDEYVRSQNVRPKDIASFDLLTEEWRAILQGPISIHDNNINMYILFFLSLAALNGSLVLVDFTSRVYMDLWFLMDFEKGLWVKQHTVEVNLSIGDGFLAQPLVILKNGSIVIYIESRRLLRIYNLRTNTCTNVAEMVYPDVIGLYTGNLLSMSNDAS